jgi:hypothetical protein
MAGVGVIWARAPSLEKLENELSRLLAGCSADDILGVSHSFSAVSCKQSGGIWRGGAQTLKLEYSAVVLVRNAQGEA